MAEELKVYPSKRWETFFKKFEEIETLKVSRWREVHLLAYICKRYKEVHGREFAVTIKGTAPSRSVDIFQTKSILTYLGTTNMSLAKDYIDWVYDTKIHPTKKAFKKIGYFLTSGFANEYKLYKAKKEEIHRSTELPKNYVEISKQLEVPVKTYGDLAFVQMAVEQNEDNKSPHYLLLKNLEMIGLNLDQLKSIGDK